MTFHYTRRVWTNHFFTCFALLSAAIGLGLLLLILYQVFVEGLGALSLDIFTKTTPSPGSSGGLINAIVGSLMMSGLAMLFSIPLGIMGGVYLAEYDRGGKIGETVRFLNDILLSAPSICFGMFAYEIVVLPTHGFSGYAGALALSFIAIPVILRTTEDMLTLVPDQLREAAAALGAPPSHIIFTICLSSARHGIVTGLLLAFARIVGETAPLLFTALNNQFWNVNMTGPTPNLPVTIYQLAMSPYADWHRLAWAGAMIITLAVLSINIVTRFFSDRADRRDFIS
jgi:phosphate transport system permease protein